MSGVEEHAKEIAAGYVFDGTTIDLGALMIEGETRPDVAIKLPTAMLNRHGLVAGATGTGKTKTLQLIAEQLSAQGVPVFLADIKGDLSGMAAPAATDEKIEKRVAQIGQPWTPAACPVEFLSLGGVGNGVPIRASMTSFGPILLAKVLGLNEIQESSLGLIFHYADKNGLPLLDVQDLRTVIQYLTSDEGATELKALGGLSKSTAGVILRQLIAFQDQGADEFFGEPEFDTADLIRLAADGRGTVSILELDAVQDRPTLFSTFLMWLLADLFEDLPEAGDLDKPKLVFFLDEAHLLFDEASKPFLDAIERTARLIRSKGVGVFFVTHTPRDVPNEILAQLSNRVQHALRAYTPEDVKALKASVSTLPTSQYDLEELLTSLGIGEAVVTVMSERGAPTPVAWTMLRPPQSLMAPCDPALMQQTIAASALGGKYAEVVDRDSAHERLSAKLAAAAAAEAAEKEAAAAEKAAKKAAKEAAAMEKEWARQARAESARTSSRSRTSSRRAAEPASPLDELFGTFAKTAATTLGREIARGIFGTARRRRR